MFAIVLRTNTTRNSHEIIAVEYQDLVKQNMLSTLPAYCRRSPDRYDYLSSTFATDQHSRREKTCVGYNADDVTGNIVLPRCRCDDILKCVSELTHFGRYLKK